MLRVVVAALSITMTVTACGKKKEESAASAGGGGGAAAAPAAPAAPGPQTLGPLGLTIDAPGGAVVTDTSVDAPAVTIDSPGCKVMVSTVTDAYASDLDAAKAEVQKGSNPFKQFTKEEKAEGGWHLEFELASVLDKSPLYGVQVRRTFGDKQFECGINASSTAERDCSAKACLSLRK